MQNRTQALKNVKGSAKIFDLDPKCAKALPLQILQEIFIEPTPNIEVEISY